jgi:hypothetical protein
MLPRVPELLIIIAHVPKLNRADWAAIELAFLEQAAGIVCLIGGAATARPLASPLDEGLSTCQIRKAPGQARPFERCPLPDMKEGAN